MTDVIDTDRGQRPPRNWRRIGVLTVVASFIGIWGYVLYLSFFVGRADLRDRLDDTEWVETAESTCAPIASAIEREPFASEIDSPDERADVIDDATDQLETMVRRLRGLVPPATAAETRAVNRWLDDWEVFNQDRREYAASFRQGEDEPFSVTDAGGYQINLLIEDFAVKANDMPSCAPPGDVG